jgi:phytoene dehydrogenase-like protein
MKQKPALDLLIIGAEPAGFAAAACAARAGAAVALVRGGEKKTRAGSVPGVPDFVWRKLNLQDAGLDAQPVSARVSLFEDGKSVATYASDRKTEEALKKSGGGDYHLWTDFSADLDRLWREGEEVAQASAAGPAKKKTPLLAALAAKDGARAARRMTASTAALLEDYFSEGRLRAHLASVALSPFGLGGDEPGSALALAALREPAAWRVRNNGKGKTLLEALEQAARNAGVEIIEARLREILVERRQRIVAFENGEAVRARRIMASSVEAAARAGLDIAPSFSPLARRDGAIADVRLKFQKSPEALEAGKNAVYYIADSLDSIADARDAVLEGRLAERMPISFEFNRDEIVVHAPYCPSFLKTENEVREWSEQDRQALGMQIVQRLEPYLNGAAKQIKRIDIRVTPAAPSPGDEPEKSVAAPPPGHDPIGAAAKLALELVSVE